MIQRKLVKELAFEESDSNLVAAVESKEVDLPWSEGSVDLNFGKESHPGFDHAYES